MSCYINKATELPATELRFSNNSHVHSKNNLNKCSKFHFQRLSYETENLVQKLSINTALNVIRAHHRIIMTARISFEKENMINI